MKEVTDHIQEVHPKNEAYKCSQCPKTEKSTSDLVRYITTKKLPTLKYHVCTHAFACGSQWKATKKKHTQQKEWTYPKDICHCSISTKRNTSKHRQIYNEQEFRYPRYHHNFSMNIFIGSMSETDAPLRLHF